MCVCLCVGGPACQYNMSLSPGATRSTYLRARENGTGAHSPCVRNGRVRARYYNITAIGLQAPNSLAMLAKITRAQTHTHTHTFLYDISSSYFIRFSERAHARAHTHICLHIRAHAACTAQFHLGRPGFVMWHRDAGSATRYKSAPVHTHTLAPAPQPSSVL